MNKTKIKELIKKNIKKSTENTSKQLVQSLPLDQSPLLLNQSPLPLNQSPLLPLDQLSRTLIENFGHVKFYTLVYRMFLYRIESFAVYKKN